MAPLSRSPADSIGSDPSLVAHCDLCAVPRDALQFRHSRHGAWPVPLSGCRGRLWTWFGQTVADDVFAHSVRRRADSDQRGIAMGAIVSINSPPLALVNMILSAFAGSVLGGSPLIPEGGRRFRCALVAYSVAGARKLIATGRRRLASRRRRARRCIFVDEFEASGRGWFWETNSLGHFVLCLPSARRRLQVRARELARPPVHRPAVGRHQRRGLVEERKTLGFHLSARFPSPTSSSARRATRTFTGRCRATRSSTSAAASLAFAASAPTSPSSAAEQEITASRASIR